MASPIALPKTLLIYTITIPLALLVGYMLTSAEETQSFAFIAACFGVLSIPLLMRWHYELLVFSWSAAMGFSMLPGHPELWMLMTMISLSFSVIAYVMVRQNQFILVPSVTVSLILLGLVVLFTAKLRGGIGIRSLGSASCGGKGYVTVLLAIAGYFAMVSQRIPLERSRAMVATYFLSALTASVGHLLVYAGPPFYFLFTIFTTNLASYQVTAEYLGLDIVRYSGFTVAAGGVFSYLLARYGIKEVVSIAHPFRLLLLILTVVVSAGGAFRSVFAGIVLIFAAQFFLEGLHRTKLLPIIAGAGVGVFLALIPLTPHLPLSIQRTLSFLPLDIDASVRASTTASTEWRIEMWQFLMPELPKYFYIGKGYNLDPTDMYLTLESTRRGFAASYENSALAGDYHSGPLSVYIPFGMPGVLAFLFFLIASVRVLYLNYRYGPPELKKFNTFCLSLFFVQAFLFIVLVGGLNSQLPTFTSLVALSIALNGGMSKAPAPQIVPALAPSAA